MDVCHGDFLIAMEPFWGVRRLKMTLPWDLKLPEWKYLIGTVHLAFPHLIEFKIDRPDVKWLLPDAVANHVPFYLAENSYTGFWGSVTTNHPMGFEYPTKIAQILEETQREIGWLNNFYMPLGKTEVKFTKALELITDIWRDSPNSFAPSPGYDSKTKLLVGGEERRRMFPQHYRNDPPAQQSTQQPTQVQPDQPNNQPNNQPDNQPYHFQQ
ncbi:hypothetical protein MMC11_003768 [Xylographa trunciseda]|nr:hypothetical protein [Xylographa trunciseda]